MASQFKHTSTIIIKFANVFWVLKGFILSLYSKIVIISIKILFPTSEFIIPQTVVAILAGLDILLS